MVYNIIKQGGKVMKEYANKQDFINEIKRTADLFIQEFNDVEEKDADLQIEGVDRTPRQMLAYQLGWMNLFMSWDKDEIAGKEVVTPAPGYKWNNMGGLYQSFYDTYESEQLQDLISNYNHMVGMVNDWLQGFDDQELFQSGARKWADSTASKWPVYKWVHINTVAPFSSFRSKIRKWKKLKVSI